MTKVSTHPLMSCDELARRLLGEHLVVLDCRHDLTAPGAGEAAYLQGHIPGARHVDLDRDLSRPAVPHEGRHPLPELEAFVTTLRRLGVSNDSSIVAYDDCGGAMAGRLWWMLRRWLGHLDVRVLDGGIGAWTAAGRSLERGAPATFRPGRFVAAAVHADEVVTTDTLIRMLENAEVILLDARATGRFDGRVEPIDPIAGHVPGAINLPFTELLRDDGCFAVPAELDARLARVIGRDDRRAVVAMCGSGVTACHLLLGLEAAGLERGRLYVGSWSEWIRDPSRAIATRTKVGADG